MKTKKEIEELAESKFNERYYAISKKGFVEGYIQCQENMVKELTEWIEITLSAESKLGASDNVIEELLNVKYKIESLNKKN